MRLEERSMKLRTVGETTIHTNHVTSIRPASQAPEALALALAVVRGGNRAACRYCNGDGTDHTWATAARCPHCAGSGSLRPRNPPPATGHPQRERAYTMAMPDIDGAELMILVGNCLLVLAISTVFVVMILRGQRP